MTPDTPPLTGRRVALWQGVAARILTASGAVLASLGVALSAYAAHAVDTAARPNLQMAAMFAFGHGVALAALAVPAAARRLGLLALAMLLLGTLLFACGLVHGQWTGMPARTAPFGGSLLILGWLVFAVHAGRAR